MLRKLHVEIKIIGPLTRQEKRVYLKYRLQCVMAKESSETTISYLMDYFILPYKPIIKDIDKFKEHNIDISFVYGNNNDFLQTDFEMCGQKIADKLKTMGIRTNSIDESEHNLPIYEPKKLTDLLKNFLNDE